MPRIIVDRSRAIFGDPSPPSNVWESQFDGFDDDLRRVAQMPWQTIPDADLWYYIHDLAYVELQPDLFAYLFPVCLNFWYRSLLDNRDCAVGDAEFHYALYRGQVLEKQVTPLQREHIYQFFIDGFLDCIDTERGFQGLGHQDSTRIVCGWIYRFNSLGVVAPLIEPLWTAWWNMNTPGQAAAALIYLSGLMYRRGESPLFAPRVKKRGQEPSLWVNDSSIFDQGWLPVNLEFFRRSLTIDYLRDKVHEACVRLADEPEAELANRISADFDILHTDVEIRIAYLLERLAAPPVFYADW